MRALLALVGGLVLAATTATPALAAPPPVNDDLADALPLQPAPGTQSVSVQQDASKATAGCSRP